MLDLRVIVLGFGLIMGVGFPARAVPPGTPAQTARHALLVGNASYRAGELGNPIRDVGAIADIVKMLGFSVTIRHDLGRKEFRNAINEFVDHLSDGDLALFYYAGHGVEIKGGNYLLPVDFEATNEDDAIADAYSLQNLIGRLEDRKRATNVVILDACRNDPWSPRWVRNRTTGTRGFVEIQALPPGTYVAFSARAGQAAQDGTGREHSPFAQAVLNHLATPGVDIDLVFRKVRATVQDLTRNQQEPWSNHNLREPLLLVSPPPPPPMPSDREECDAPPGMECE